MDERATEPELLAHAAREFAREPIAEIVEPRRFQQRRDTRCRARSFDWPKSRPKNSMFSRTLRSG